MSQEEFSETKKINVFNFLRQNGIATLEKIPYEIRVKLIYSRPCSLFSPKPLGGSMQRKLNVEFFSNDAAKGNHDLSQKQVQFLEMTARHVFELLKKAWAEQKMILAELKVEFGFDTKTQEILLYDISWHIYPKPTERK